MKVFHNSVSRWFFHWSLSDSKSLQVSRTFLSILVELNKAVVWIVSTCPLILKSSSSFTNSFGSVASASPSRSPSCSIVFRSLAKSRYLSHFFSFLLILLCGLPGWQSPLFRSLFVVVIVVVITGSGRLVEIRWSVYISKFHYYYFTICEFFTLILNGGFSLRYGDSPFSSFNCGKLCTGLAVHIYFFSFFFSLYALQTMTKMICATADQTSS